MHETAKAHLAEIFRSWMGWDGQRWTVRKWMELSGKHEACIEGVTDGITLGP